MATKKVPDTQAPANTPESFAAVREVFGKHPVDVIDPIEWGPSAHRSRRCLAIGPRFCRASPAWPRSKPHRKTCTTFSPRPCCE